MIRRLRERRARISTYFTWCFILALPRARRQRVIDAAIRDTPGFRNMSIDDQDQAIARYVWAMARYQRQ